MKIKPNTYYLTRSGKKAFVVARNPFESKAPQEFVGFITGFSNVDSWNEDGRWWSVGEHRNDLVTELPEVGK